jgi:hypothetical protein
MAAEPAAPSAANKLAEQQEQVAAKFKRFEDLLLRLAEDASQNDPKRAALLRKAVARSKDSLLGVKLDRVAELLASDRLSAAITDQGGLSQDFRALLDLLLSEDSGQRLEAEKKRIAELLKQVNKLIQEQEAIASQTQQTKDPKTLAPREGKLADKTGQLAQQAEADERAKQAAEDQAESPPKDKPQDSSDPSGESGEPKPGSDEPSEDESSDKPADSESSREPQQSGEQSSNPSDQNQPSSDQESQGQQSQGQPSQGQPGSQPQPSGESPPSESSPQSEQGESGKSEQQESTPQRLQRAQQAMRAAQRKLAEAQREQAAEQEQEALRELEQAKAELERTLRQLRQEEMAETLAQLEERFQRMLDIQRKVLAGTQALSEIDSSQRERSHQLESARLGQQETKLVLDCDKVLTLLEQDGTAVAFREATSGIRADLALAAERLGRFDVGDLTQGIEQDVIESLEEMLAALDKAQEELEKQMNQGQQGQQGGGEDQPLVDPLSELKLIRSLQLRVNRRTQHIGESIEGEQAADPKLLEVLAELAQREARIREITRQIATGKNQ